MQRVVLLLRAVNVGKNRIKMADLANTLESAGLRDVRTVLASGNVIATLPGQSGQNAN